MQAVLLYQDWAVKGQDKEASILYNLASWGHIRILSVQHTLSDFRGMLQNVEM